MATAAVLSKMRHRHEERQMHSKNDKYQAVPGKRSKQRRIFGICVFLALTSLILPTELEAREDSPPHIEHRYSTIIPTHSEAFVSGDIMKAGHIQVPKNSRFSIVQQPRPRASHKQLNSQIEPSYLKTDSRIIPLSKGARFIEFVNHDGNLGFSVHHLGHDGNLAMIEPAIDNLQLNTPPLAQQKKNNLETLLFFDTLPIRDLISRHVSLDPMIVNANNGGKIILPGVVSSKSSRKARTPRIIHIENWVDKTSSKDLVPETIPESFLSTLAGSTGVGVWARQEINSSAREPGYLSITLFGLSAPSNLEDQYLTNTKIQPASRRHPEPRIKKLRHTRSLRPIEIRVDKAAQNQTHWKPGGPNDPRRHTRGFFVH